MEPIAPVVSEGSRIVRHGWAVTAGLPRNISRSADSRDRLQPPVLRDVRKFVSSSSPCPDFPSFSALEYRHGGCYNGLRRLSEHVAQELRQFTRSQTEWRASPLLAVDKETDKLAPWAEQLPQAMRVVGPHPARQRSEKGALVNEIEGPSTEIVREENLRAPRRLATHPTALSLFPRPPR